MIRFIRVSDIVFASLVVAFATVASLTAWSETDSRDHYESKNEEAIIKWMKNASGAPPKTVSGAWELGRFRGATYFLRKEIGWQPNSEDVALPSVSIPKGFVTDFASIPPLFFSILRADGEYAFAAIIHDYLYWAQNGSRKDADLTLWYAMEDFRVAKPKALAIYGAVRAGGWWAWRQNTRERAKGCSRVLVKFPQDPTTTWQAWRQRPNVFASDC